MSAAFHVALLAVVAGASPLALTATLGVIESARPRADGIGFAIGYVVGTALACLVGLVAGTAFADRIDSHDTIEAVVELLAGAALVAVGARAARSEPGPEKSGRGTAIMAGLHETGPAAAFSMAALLGFGGPKRLLFTLLAMTAISGDGPVWSTTLVFVYVAISAALVWAPVLFMILARDRAEPMLQRCESWVRTHARGLRVWISLTFGAVLVVDGLLRIVV
jgi:threonine/homoserine/homoserine lactone efflux protein